MECATTCSRHSSPIYWEIHDESPHKFTSYSDIIYENQQVKKLISFYKIYTSKAGKKDLCAFVDEDVQSCRDKVFCTIVMLTRKPCSVLNGQFSFLVEEKLIQYLGQLSYFLKMRKSHGIHNISDKNEVYIYCNEDLPWKTFHGVFYFFLGKFHKCFNVGEFYCLIASSQLLKNETKLNEMLCNTSFNREEIKFLIEKNMHKRKKPASNLMESSRYKMPKYTEAVEDAYQKIESNKRLEDINQQIKSMYFHTDTEKREATPVRVTCNNLIAPKKSNLPLKIKQMNEVGGMLSNAEEHNERSTLKENHDINISQGCTWIVHCEPTSHSMPMDTEEYVRDEINLYHRYLDLQDKYNSHTNSEPSFRVFRNPYNSVSSSELLLGANTRHFRIKTTIVGHCNHGRFDGSLITGSSHINVSAMCTVCHADQFEKHKNYQFHVTSKDGKDARNSCHLESFPVKSVADEPSTETNSKRFEHINKVANESEKLTKSSISMKRHISNETLQETATNKVKKMCLPNTERKIDQSPDFTHDSVTQTFKIANSTFQAVQKQCDDAFDHNDNSKHEILEDKKTLKSNNDIKTAKHINITDSESVYSNISISNDDLDAAKKMICDDADFKDSRSNYDLPNVYLKTELKTFSSILEGREDSFQLPGFQTASGKTVKISNEALETGKKLLSDDMNFENCEIDDELSNKTIQSAKNMFLLSSIPESDKNSKQFTGFQTSSGKPVNTSKFALKSAQNTLHEEMHCCNVDYELDYDLTHEVLESANMSLSTNIVKKENIQIKSFQTGCDTPVELLNNIQKSSKQIIHGDMTFNDNKLNNDLTNKKLEITQNMLSPTNNIDNDGKRNMQFEGFQTAVDKPVKISSDAMKFAQKMLHDDMDIKDCELNDCHKNIGLKIPKNISTNDLHSTKKSMQVTDFQIAAEEVKISSEALESAQKMLHDEMNVIGCESNDLENGAKKSAKDMFLSTSIINLEKENMQFTGFQTASGKAVKISNDALEAAQKMLHDDSKNYESDDHLSNEAMEAAQKMFEYDCFNNEF